MLATGIAHMARDSILSDDSVLEDLAARLRDFPHVPDKVLPLRCHRHTVMLPPIICQDGHHISRGDSPSLPSLVIDMTSETVLGELPYEEEGDATKDFLDASRILRGHPGLVMEHYDPTTSVHTFKIVSPRRYQDESPRLSSPSTPCLSHSSRNSSPLTSTLQTPPSGPFRRLGSVSSRERLGSHTALDSLDRIKYPASSSASEFPKSMARPLRRSASEFSHRPPSIGTRYMSRRLHQDLSPTISTHSSQPSSSTISSALDGLAHGSALHLAGASHERGATISPTSDNDLRLLDARWSPASSDQLLAFRELLSQRAQDASTDSRSCVSSSDPDRRHPFDDSREDVASDCSDYGESILSGRQYSLDEPDNLASADGASTSEDLWSKLSITRTMRTWDSPDNYSLLANGDTFLDMHPRSSSPTSQLQSESPQPRIDPDPQRTGSRSPTPTVSMNPDELHEFLPNFLDLHLGVDMTGSVTNEVSSGTDNLHFSQDDGRPELVPECSSAANARGIRGERPGVMLAQQPPVTSHGPRRVQSAAELVSSPSLPTRPPLPGQDDHRGYDRGTGPQAEYSELAQSESKTEPDNLRRGNSHRVKRVQNLRATDGQHANPGSSVAVDSGSRFRKVFSVSQRHRAMTLQEVAVTGTSTTDRLHRSATTMTSTPSSVRTGGRYRTLEDRAYRHPDVPHSPLYSDLDHGPSTEDAYHASPSLREPSDGRKSQVSSPETGHIPLTHSRNPSSEVYSRNASPRPPVPRPHVPPNHSRNGSYPARKRPVQGYVHRPGSSLDSRPGSSLRALPPPSTLGIGLSLIDNGAFEAPRPAPEPRTVTHEKADASPSRMVVQRVAPPAAAAAAAEEPTTDDVPKRDLDPVTALPLTSLSGFPRRVWSKRRKQAPPRSDGLRPRLGSASSSELDLKSSSSFISMVESEHDHHVKPQRKRLLSFMRK